ncbi:hypothetical protein [Gloeobacter kilaueensis]|uniref:Uncharacterized protein n=1 Tax=Gloeobacter kilaueensis (strain ATCC BAA-2537 / CCAP 1431/1 / ULC 316 / JS1) TaxID=1183438 RepID=U5QCF2_GLOK1|nr:hypothetical protein [Gloeobacter kilaueensis]AGY56546.1 hypothetical protein GKIL_0299 [Gloeobacter kilaueensis JS1]
MNLRPMHFDGAFVLEPEAKETLFALLTGEAFSAQICAATGLPAVQFTELLFQPVPYSPQTPYGMAREFEPYYKSSEYVVINVPANFLFKAQISKPNRLCAIYRKG